MKLRTLVTLTAIAGATLTPFAASAAGVVEASPTGKGIAGGALLGAELVLATEAAFDVQAPWAYVVGGLAGGAAGGVGGYFVEDQGDARAPMLMLAGGLAFAIPTIVAVLAATAYEPPASYLQDQMPVDEPLAEPPAPTDLAPGPVAPPPADPAPTSPPPDGAGAPAPTQPGQAAPPPAQPDQAVPAPGPTPTGRRHLPAARRLSLKLPPPALLGFRESALALGVPNVELRHSYTRAERVMFNAPDVTEWNVPVLNVVF